MPTSDGDPDAALADRLLTPPLARQAGPLAIAAGALFAVAQLLSFVVTGPEPSATTLASASYRIAAVLMLVAFAGLAIAAVALHERHAVRLGRLGAVALCAALLGTFLLGGDYWFETFAVPWYSVVLPEILRIPGAGWLAVGGLTSYLAFSAGWLLFAVSAFRARVASRPACVALAAGAVVGLYAALPPWGAPLGLAVVWLGLDAARPRPAGGGRQAPRPPRDTERTGPHHRADVRAQRSAAALAVVGLLALPACTADVTSRVDGLAGDLRLSTQAAAVEGHGLTSDEVRIATEAGAAELEFREAPSLVRTTTTLGAVSLRVPGDTSYAVDVTTSVGAARVEVPRDPASSHRIEVRTEVGGVAIERAR